MYLLRHDYVLVSLLPQSIKTSQEWPRLSPGMDFRSTATTDSILIHTRSDASLGMQMKVGRREVVINLEGTTEITIDTRRQTRAQQMTHGDQTPGERHTEPCG